MFEPSGLHASPQDAGDAAAVLGSAADAAASRAPLEEIFFALAEDANDRRVRRACRRMAGELARGATFRDAIAVVGSALPAYVTQALLAASESGNMPQVLEAFSRHETVRRRLRRRIWSAMLYPLLVIAMFALVCTGLTLVVVPELIDIYQEFGIALPESTLAMLAFSNLAPYLLLGAAACVVAWCVLWLAPGGKRIACWLRTGAPLFGRMWICAGQHEFASVLGILAAEGVPLPEALQSTAASLRDRNIARAVRIVSRKCEEGLLLSRGLGESIHFDPALPALVGWGEVHGALPDALRQAAATYEEEIDVFAYFLQRALPPLLFASITLMIIAFMTVVIMPMISLLSGWM